MNSVPLQVLLYAFVALASPVALGATLVVLGSRGGRWNALAFAVGVVIGQAVLCAVAYAVGSAAMPVGHHTHETRGPSSSSRSGSRCSCWAGWCGSGHRTRRRSPTHARRSCSRLEHLNLPAVFGAGAVLALGPKRLGLTVLVTATIAGGNIGAVYAFSLTVAYVVIATALVTVPVVLAIVFGTRGEQWMLEVEHWLSAHKRPLTVYPVTILGVLVIVDAVFALA